MSFFAKSLAFVLIAIFCLPFQSHAEEKAGSGCWLSAPLTGTVGPAGLDLLERVLAEAQNQKCRGVLLEINTPGGNLQTTRLMVELILNSPLPFVCWVGPAGGHAGSAGAILLQACHVAAAEASTNIGAATPINSTGQEMPKDLRAKVVNDTISWVENLAELRGRSKTFARDIVEKAKSVTAREALQLNAIDLVAASSTEALEKSQGRKVSVQRLSVPITSGAVIPFEPGLRHSTLQWIADPEFAYMLFMGSLALLYFEITHPGTVVPGVLGAMGLLTSMIAFHKLNVSWGGVLLMILGAVFLILEIFVTSFGVLAVAGIASLGIGALLLFDPVLTGYSLPLGLIAPPLIFLAGVMIWLGYLLSRLKKIPRQVGKESMLGAHVKVVEVETPGVGWNRYRVDLGGELWHALSRTEFQVGDEAKISVVDGLTLHIQRL